MSKTVVYVNAMRPESSGEAFAKGVRQSLDRTSLKHDLKIDFVSLDIFYGRRLSPREMGAFARAHNASAVVLSGSGKNTTDRDDPWLQEYYEGLGDLLNLRPGREWLGPECPVLGICFGHQALAILLGGETSRFKQRAGLENLKPLNAAASHPVLSEFVRNKLALTMPVLHADQVVRLPNEFVPLLTSDYCDIQAMAHKQWPIVSFQPHPEIGSAVKAAPDERVDWESVASSDLDDHAGALVLDRFFEWALFNDFENRSKSKLG
jgi:GMP synthase-like glutamine amidotransferase